MQFYAVAKARVAQHNNSSQHLSVGAPWAEMACIGTTRLAAREHLPNPRARSAAGRGACIKWERSRFIRLRRFPVLAQLCSPPVSTGGSLTVLELGVAHT